MKRLILSFSIIISFFSLSLGFEANVKVGYDFYRSATVTDRNETTKFIKEKYGNGFVFGVELLPLTFKDEIIKLGVGVEYNFGNNNVRYETQNQYYEQENVLSTMIPVYATAKFTYYRPDNIDLNLYTFARLGYAFAKEFPHRDNRSNTSGVYYGLGLGLDYKYFLAELLYDGKYHSNSYFQDYQKSFHHKIGIRLGVQLGAQHFKEPKI